MDLGPHGGFILASYGAMIAILVGLALWLFADGRRHNRALSELEHQGIKRRRRETSAPDRD